MAGKSERPDPPTGPSGAKPSARTFSCTNCGASIIIRYPGNAMSVACEACHSVIDVTNSNYKILSKYKEETSGYSPLLPLGSRGQLFGRLWEVLGYMVREDVGSGFSWDEYLLFNPYYGYRWLAHSKGHWNFVTPIKKIPVTSRSYKLGTPEFAYLDDQGFRLFYRGQAAVLFVLGEFYWRVKANSTVAMEDFICPPQMLSSEADETEINWSLSEYVERSVIRDAFKLDDPSLKRMPIGVAPNQPSKSAAAWKTIKWLWMMFLVICTGIEIVHVAGSANKDLLDFDYIYVPNTKIADVTTPVFTAVKDKANMSLTFSTPVENSWYYVSGELVNNKTGETYPFEKSIEYYHGYDSDGSWSEGGRESKVMFSGIPGGQYYLNLDMESGSFQDRDARKLTLTVRRDVPTFSNYFWCLLFVSIVPCLAWWSSRSFEVARWSDSDFSPYPSGSDSE